MCVVWSNFWFLLLMNKLIDSLSYGHVSIPGIWVIEKPGTPTKTGTNKLYPEVTATLSQILALMLLQRTSKCLTYQDELMWLLLGQPQGMITPNLPSEISANSDWYPLCNNRSIDWQRWLFKSIWGVISLIRYRGPGFDPRRYQIFWVVVGLERGPLSLVRSNWGATWTKK